MSRHYHFKFTINNYTEEHQTNLRALNYKYLVYGFEIAPDTGTPHLQGHISFHTQRTVGSVIKKIPGHISVADLPVASIAYCKKGGNFWEDGTPPCKNGGKQTELITKERIQECVTWDAVLSIPNIANKMAFARECWRLKPRSMDTVDTLRPWQEEELALLLNQDDRQIRFIVDLKGGMGKSVLGRYLHEKHGAFYTRGGKLSDIAYAYNYEPIVVFDLARCNNGECWPYAAMECFKDGMLFSPKYESQTKKFPSCKVIVFCNQEPDYEKLSADRISTPTKLYPIFTQPPNKANQQKRSAPSAEKV